MGPFGDVVAAGAPLVSHYYACQLVSGPTKPFSADLFASVCGNWSVQVACRCFEFVVRVCEEIEQ